MPRMFTDGSLQAAVNAFCSWGFLNVKQNQSYPFKFEGAEVPSSNSGRLVMRRLGISWPTPVVREEVRMWQQLLEHR